LYRQAWKSKTDLHLTEKEHILLQADTRDSVAQVCIGMAGLVFALLKLSTLSGVAFLCIPVWLMIHAFFTKRKLSQC
jgi:hypothetical protein